jgi:hypothetical protein
MPQPPILPLIDWRALFSAGTDWRRWLDIAEKPEHKTELLGSYGGFHPTPETVRRLQALAKPVHIIAIAESWCGDVRRHVPVLQKIADAGGQVQVRYITRAQNVDVFARLLTNGGEAIPKAVFLSRDFVETGNWGPMPENGRRIIAQGKAANDITGARKLVAAQYAADPQRRDAESEIINRIEIAATQQVAAAFAGAAT